MMERIRDSRRTSCSSNSNSISSNGFTSRRRPRFRSNDSEEEDEPQIMSMSPETAQLTDDDCRARRKERERERLRKLLNSGKKRRRSGNSYTTRPVKASRNRRNSSARLEAYKERGEEEEEEEEDEYEEESGPFGQSRPKILKFKSPLLPSPDRFFSLSIPRNSRSAGVRRKRRIWSQIEVDSEVEIPAPSIPTKNNIETEIAEVLYGLNKQPSLSSGDPEPIEFPPYGGDSSSRSMDSHICVNKSEQQSALSQGKVALLGCVRMHEGAVQVPVKNEEPSVSAVEPQIRTSLKERDKEVDAEDDPEIQVAKKETNTTKEDTSSLEIKKKEPRKFVIDLMAPPPMDSSPEDDYEVDGFRTDFETVTSKSSLVAGEFQKEDNRNYKKHIPNMRIKCEVPDPALEIQYQTSRDLGKEFQKEDPLSSNYVLPKAQPGSSSCIPSWLAGGCSARQTSQKLVETPLQRKRCVTHYNIACSIYSHQKGTQAKSFLPKVGDAPSVYGTCRSGLQSMIKSETEAYENVVQLNSLAWNPITVKEESRGIESNRSENYPHQIPRPVSTGYTKGGIFITGPTEKQAITGLQNGNSMSASPKDFPVSNNPVATVSPLVPGSASLIRFSYPNGLVPNFAALPSNKEAKPISNEVTQSSRRENSRGTPFFMGSSKVYVPVEVPQQWARSHQNTLGTKYLNSPRWHLQSGRFFLESEKQQPRQEKKHHIFAPMSSNVSETRCLNFTLNQNPGQNLSLSSSHPSVSQSAWSEITDCFYRAHNSTPSFPATHNTFTCPVPTTRTFKVPPSAKNQLSSLSANYSKDFSALSESTLHKHSLPVPPQSDFLSLSSNSQDLTHHHSKQKSTSQTQQISFGRIFPAPEIAQQRGHHHFQSLNSSSMLDGYGDGSLSRTKTNMSDISGNESSGMVVFSGGKPAPLIPIAQTESTLGGTTQKSPPLCGRNVPSILGHLPELKY